MDSTERDRLPERRGMWAKTIPSASPLYRPRGVCMAPLSGFEATTMLRYDGDDRVSTMNPGYQEATL